MKKMVIDGDVLVYSLAWVYDKNPGISLERLIRTKLANISRTLGISKGRLLLSGSVPKEQTYRYNIATLQPYKGNRSNKDKPQSFDRVKSMLLSFNAQVIEDGLEVDDYLAIEQGKAPEDIVICSTDKDLKMIPGYHYNWVTDTATFISPLEGYYSFCKQLLTGDRIDNIKGLSEKKPLKGIGDKTAHSLLSSCSSYSSMFQEVLKQYHLHYSDSFVYPHWLTQQLITSNAESILLETGRLLWIRRHPQDVWCPPF